MITNERQYRITKAQASRFREAIKEFNELALIADGIDPVIANAQREGLESQLDELETAIARFDALRSGRVRQLEAECLAEIGKKLIEARIVRGLSQKELAEKLGLKQQQIQRYEQESFRAASLSRLVEFTDALGASVKVRLVLANGDGDGSRRSKSAISTLRLPHREMRKRGWFADLKRETNNLTNGDIELANLYVQHASGFGVRHALHKQTRLSGGYDEGALMAWKARVLHLARDANPSSEARAVEESVFIKELASLSQLDDGPARAVDMLRESGVTLVVERHLAKTHLDGAAMLLDGKHPVIGLTLRHDRLDNFWFVLFHELGHIVRHRQKGLEDGFFDEESAEVVEKAEREADDFARNALIPDELWRSSFVQYAYSPDKIRIFAERAGVHAAIVAGRIRRERKDYSIFSNLVGRNKLRAMFGPNSGVPGGYRAN